MNSGVLFENIPQELRDRPQWVLWRYEERNGKPEKVPFVAGELRHARTNRSSTWRSFKTAVAAYQERPDYFSGIGYVFADDDPYVGGDMDNCIVDSKLSDFAREHLPMTYAEISPSGSGIKFIARASGTYSRHKPNGELYSSSRFFTITGRVLDQDHAKITDQQSAIDKFLTVLNGDRASKTSSNSSATANGNRAALAASIPPAVFDAAAVLYRTQAAKLLQRVKAAKKETQLAVALSGDYERFNKKWPFVGIYRDDGSVDDSQVRCVVACGLYGRGYTLAEYIAIMSLLFGCAKGSKAKWRQELADLWLVKAPQRVGYTPRTKAATPDVVYSVPSTPRGRAGDHAGLVDRVYRQLLDYRINADALVQTSKLAASLGLHRLTVVKALNELRNSGRITTRRAGQYGGLVVSFSDVVHSNPTEVDQPVVTPDTETEVAAHEETHDLTTTCVSSDRASHDNICLADAVTECFDVYANRPRQHTAKNKLRREPLTRKKIASYVESNYPDLAFSDVQLDKTLEAERRRRRIDELKTMSPRTLAAQLRMAERLAEKDRELGGNAWRWWSYFADMARREMSSRPADPKRPKNGYKPCEAKPNPRDVAEALQEQMWGVVDDDRARRPAPAPVARAAKVEPVAPDAIGLIARLRAQQQEGRMAN